MSTKALLVRSGRKALVRLLGKARTLYESLGFTYYGDRMWDENGRGWLLRMQRDLKSPA